MSKRTRSLGKTVRTHFAGPKMIEALEGRQLMSAGPANIANGGANDAVFKVDTNELHVAYYDTQAKSLKHQAFHDDGTAGAVTTIDATGNSGQFLSLAQDGDGVLHAAYYDAANADLKYARRSAAGVWSTQTIDSKNTVGLYPSIAIDANDRPVISYYAKTGGNLKLATFNGAAWNISTLASTNDVGRYSSLALHPGNGKLAVAFEDTSTGGLKYAEQANNWVLQTADTTPKGGGYISLDFKDGRPAMSYYDAANANLKYAERSSRNKWTAEVVAANNSQGLYTDLEFTYNTNQPAIVYWNKTQDTAMLAFRTTGGAWAFETQVTGGGRNLTAVDGPEIGNDAPALYIIATDTATGMLKVRTL